MGRKRRRTLATGAVESEEGGAEALPSDTSSEDDDDDDDDEEEETEQELMRPPSDDDDDDEGDGEAMDEAGDGQLDAIESNEIINVIFDVETFVDDDFHALRNFVAPLLDDYNQRRSSRSSADAAGAPQWVPGELAEAVLSARHVGSTVKVFPEDETDEEPPEVYGFVSLVNLHAHLQRGAAWAMAMRVHLLESCGDDERSRAALEAYFDDHSTPLGLLLNEHAINLPPALIPPLHKCLFEEVERAGGEHQVANVLIVTRMLRDYESPAQKNRRFAAGGGGSGSGKKKFGKLRGGRRKGGGRAAGSGSSSSSSSSTIPHRSLADEEERVYPKLEDAAYRRCADFTLSFPIRQAHSSAQPQLTRLAAPYRLVMVVPMARVPEVLAELDTW